jgi:PHD/YefM family antitoxin component YafN of YafNO toxin-antitoxin module
MIIPIEIEKNLKTGRPIFLEKNGKTKAVVLSAEEYEKIQLWAMLEEAADDIANGRVHTPEEVYAELRADNRRLAEMRK